MDYAFVLPVQVDDRVVATIVLSALSLLIVWALAAFSQSEFTREQGPYKFERGPEGTLVAGIQTLPGSLDGGRPTVEFFALQRDQRGRIRRTRLLRRSLTIQVRRRRIPSEFLSPDDDRDVVLLPPTVVDQLREALDARAKTGPEFLDLYVRFKFRSDPYSILFHHPDVSLRGAALVTLLTCLFSVAQGLLLR